MNPADHDRRLNAIEVEAFAGVVAQFHALTGREPDDAETTMLVDAARALVALGTGSKAVH